MHLEGPPRVGGDRNDDLPLIEFQASLGRTELHPQARAGREKGVWERVATALQDDADMEHLFIDSTIVRAHQHSGGAQKKPAVRKSAARAAD